MLNVELFSKPSENVRGIVNCVLEFKGKTKRVAHATLFTDRDPSISLEVPSRVAVADIEGIAQAFQEFGAKVKELDAARG